MYCLVFEYVFGVFFIKDSTINTGRGRMWSWGHNTRGQLGLGDGLYGGDPRFPNEIPGAPAVVMPSFCFDEHSEELIPERRCAPSRWAACMHACMHTYIHHAYYIHTCMHACIHTYVPVSYTHLTLPTIYSV